ncbi:MAG: YdcF family protein [Solirubrobacterales bacterium]
MWKQIRRKTCRWMRNNRLLAGFIIAGLMICAGIEGSVIGFGMNTQPQQSDAIVILGCRLRGEKPSTFLAARAREGLRLYRQGYAPLIVVSGGKGPGETLSEAGWMRDYLVARGVPERAVLVEDRSHTTEENLRFTAALLSARGKDHVLIVSNGFHLKRADFYAREAGLRPSFSGVYLTNWRFLIKQAWGYGREVPALIVAWTSRLKPEGGL